MFPTSGTVNILREQMGRVELARLRRFIGHVNPRHRLQYSLTVREVVMTGITAGPRLLSSVAVPTR
jgi:iron complex transport system ATP-binding protein